MEDFSPRNQSFLCVTYILCVWNVTCEKNRYCTAEDVTGRLAVFHFQVTGLSMAPEGLMATSSTDGSVRVWVLRNKEQALQFQVKDQVWLYLFIAVFNTQSVQAPMRDALSLSRNNAHTHMHTHMCMCVCRCAHTHTHTHTTHMRSHTRTHPHAHTHSHTSHVHNTRTHALTTFTCTTLTRTHTNTQHNTHIHNTHTLYIDYAGFRCATVWRLLLPHQRQQQQQVAAVVTRTTSQTVRRFPLLWLAMGMALCACLMSTPWRCSSNFTLTLCPSPPLLSLPMVRGNCF